MPKLWSDTIDAHRRSVRDAVLHATAMLVARHGLTGVTMSEVAIQAGIGRATLYKYFPDTAAILREWHQQQVSAHLAHLAQVRDQFDDPRQRLEAVLLTYAHITRHHPHGEIAAQLHQGPHMAQANTELSSFVQALLRDAGNAIRTDTSTADLAAYCLHALEAARVFTSDAAVIQLVAIIMRGLTTA